MRLLLVEDEKKVAEFVARGLRAERFAVDVAQDGDTGWRMAASLDYDLIILDLMLPGLPGAELLQRVRRNGMAGRTVTVKLYHDAAHPSALYVPMGQPERASAPSENRTSG